MCFSSLKFGFPYPDILYFSRSRLSLPLFLRHVFLPILEEAGFVSNPTMIMDFLNLEGFVFFLSPLSSASHLLPSLTLFLAVTHLSMSLSPRILPTATNLIDMGNTSYLVVLVKKILQLLVSLYQKSKYSVIPDFISLLNVVSQPLESMELMELLVSESANALAEIIGRSTSPKIASLLFHYLEQVHKRINSDALADLWGKIQGLLIVYLSENPKAGGDVLGLVEKMLASPFESQRAPAVVSTGQAVKLPAMGVGLTASPYQQYVSKMNAAVDSREDAFIAADLGNFGGISRFEISTHINSRSDAFSGLISSAAINGLNHNQSESLFLFSTADAIKLWSFNENPVELFSFSNEIKPPFPSWIQRSACFAKYFASVAFLSDQTLHFWDIDSTKMEFVLKMPYKSGTRKIWSQGFCETLVTDSKGEIS